METEDNPSTAEVQSNDVDSSKAALPSPDQDQELKESGNCSSESTSKSSPFHGFSSQDEADNEKEEEKGDVAEAVDEDAATKTEIKENSNEGHLKNMLMADFEIGTDM